MTKSKINPFMKIIQNDQQSLNINSLNYSFTANFDQTFFSSTQLSMNYETEIFIWGIISITLTLTVLCAFILIPLAIYLVCHYRQLKLQVYYSSHIISLSNFRCINSTTFIENLQTVYYDGHQLNWT